MHLPFRVNVTSFYFLLVVSLIRISKWQKKTKTVWKIPGFIWCFSLYYNCDYPQIQYTELRVMPYVKVYVHAVWCTKNREPFLNNLTLRQTMWDHIKMNALKKDIHIDFVNGHSEHCHCLISLKADQTISKVIQLIKGESAYWFNKQKFIKRTFEWQNDYYATGVSASMIEKTRRYIMNQEEHHRKKTFAEENDELLKIFGFGKSIF